jgi:hypothetical protein
VYQPVREPAVAHRSRRKKLVLAALFVGLVTVVLLAFGGPALANTFIMVPVGDAAISLGGTSPHYAQVADGDDSTSVRTSGPQYLRDAYSMAVPSHVNTGGPIKSVAVYVRVRCDAGTGTRYDSAKTYLSAGGVEGNATTITLPDTNWHEYSRSYSVNPSTSKAWTWADLGSLRAGVALRCAYQSGVGSTYCSEVWVLVDYRVPPFTLVPISNASGAIQLQARPVGTSNYACVADGLDTSYVANIVDADNYIRDRYGLSARPWSVSAPPAATIDSVTVHMRLSRESDVRYQGFGKTVDSRVSAMPIIYSGGKEAAGPAIKIYRGIFSYNDITHYVVPFTQNPFTKTAWTWDQLSTLQAGVALRDPIVVDYDLSWVYDYRGISYCHQLFVTVEYNGAPYQIIPPAALTIFYGRSASFTSSVAGASCTVHWEQSTNGGRSWTDVSHTLYPTADTTRLDLGVPSVSYSGRYYRAVFSGPLGWATSTATRLTVLPSSAAPTITSLSPATGLSTGGTSVTINGTNLTGASAVTFGGTPATGVVVNSAGTQITAVSPAHAAGTVQVQVTTPNGSATANYTYVTPPASTRYDQTNTNIVKTGTWEDFLKTEAYLGSYGRSSTAGATATIYFTGTKIAWIGMKGTTTGIVDVYLDSTTAKTTTIDLTATAASYQLTLWTSPTLANTTHYLRLVRAPSSATGKFLTLDAVDIWGSIKAGP